MKTTKDDGNRIVEKDVSFDSKISFSIFAKLTNVKIGNGGGGGQDIRSKEYSGGRYFWRFC
ncbi:MAG: hypothetical protein LBT09_07715, partial [Planctomycetaceae bacterium]|nr:hypothetical protein [Planctomycetaceae bacterium]